ncbi:MAG: prepilin-type N-terminal cleavage/methylation domain-containing protein [bacterium]
MIYSNIKNRGFTILETLVAITIILIAITGPLDIIAHSLKASYYSRDEVTAFYLAQEAIEYARNERDNNELSQYTAVKDWLVGAVGSRDGSIDCLNDAGKNPTNKCILLQTTGGDYKYQKCVGACGIMYKNNEGIYGAENIGNLPPTNFTREIYFTKVPDESVLVGSRTPADPTRNEVIATVTVYWDNSVGSGNKFTLNTHLFNWKITE